MMLRIVLMFLVFFQAISGLYGGLSMVFDPSGDLLQMPLSLLEGTPFKNYLIPGLILSVLLGVFPSIVAYGLVRQPEWRWGWKLNIYEDQHWAWTFSLYLGLTLILWIDFQLMFIGYQTALQSIYAFLGVAILIAALSPPVKNYYSNKEGR